MNTFANGKIRRLRQTRPDANGKRHGGNRHAVVTTGQTRVDCAVLDLSVGGAKLRLFGELPPYSTQAWLVTDFLGPIPAQLAWESGCHIGLRFMSDAPIVRRLKTLLATAEEHGKSVLGGGYRDGNATPNRRRDLSLLERF